MKEFYRKMHLQQKEYGIISMGPHEFRDNIPVGQEHKK